MAKAEFGVEWATTDPVRLRAEAAGRVHVRALEPLKCQGIDLTVGYRTIGDCNYYENLIHQIKGEPVELQPGSAFEREFKVRLPDRPISFQGKYFKVIWFARVEVRLPWARDLVKESELTVLPALAGSPPATVP